MSVGNKILTTVCACTINALQGNVPAIKLALGVAILTHRTSFIANNVSTGTARYSVEWPVNLLPASWFVSEMSVKQQITLCDPIWEVASRSSEVNFTKNYTLLYLSFFCTVGIYGAL